MYGVLEKADESKVLAVSANSPIEWTGSTWNPTLGCSKKSPGCKNCYAIRVAHRLQANPDPKIAKAFEGLTVIQNGAPNWTGRINFVPDRLSAPLRKRKPTTYFVNSLSDLFDLTDEQIYHVFSVMHQCPQHTFQILTKEAQRMHELCSSWIARFDGNLPIGTAWPLPNVWLGVSVENQQYANERIPLLLQTPAAVRFISAEPLLGPIDLDSEHASGLHALGCGGSGDEHCHNSGCRGINWVIAGGESGPGARPAHPDWFRGLRDQCQSAGVPFFFKQWGEFQLGSTEFGGPKDYIVLNDGRFCRELDLEQFQQLNQDARNNWPQMQPNAMGKVGKKAAGSLLDGVEWRQMPHPATKGGVHA